MSAHELEPGGEPRSSVAQTIALYLAGAAIFLGIGSLFYYPLRLSIGGLIAAMVAAGMGGQQNRHFTAIAVAVATLGFMFGMIIAIVLDRPIF